MFNYKTLNIKLVEKDDLEFLLELRKSSWETLGNIKMLNMYSQDKWFEFINNNVNSNYYILCRFEKNIGMIRTDEIDWINRSIRIGVDIVEREKNQGYGKEAVELILKYCFDYLNMRRIWLMVLETNFPAIKIYESNGFIEEGRQKQAIFRNGKYIDYIMMGIIKDNKCLE